MIFVAQHLVAFLVVLAAAAGAGTLCLGRRYALALRAACGFAVLGHALFLLGLVGSLTPASCGALAVLAIAGGAARARAWPRVTWSHAAIASLAFAPLFLLALYPPLAFDEILYHLPYTRAFAETGAVGFFPAIRFGIFPPIQELLCVPLYLFTGDTSTHLVPLAQTLVTAALLQARARERKLSATFVAPALFIGSPLVVYLATTGYVESAMTLFVAAGFYVLDRASVDNRRLFAMAGFFFGTAVGVKYTSIYFAAAGIALVFLLTRKVAPVAMTSLGVVAGAAPVLSWIAVRTGNPVFPFAASLFGSNGYSFAGAERSIGERVVSALRLAYDVTFARERVGLVPPITPFLIAIALIAVMAAVRDRRARSVVAISAGYMAVFVFLPPDARYLVPLLPLSCAVAAAYLSESVPWLRASRFALVVLAFVAAMPGIGYALYRASTNGAVPVTTGQRERLLEQRLPEYRGVVAAGESRLYACHAEHLHYYGRGEFLGDWSGPYAYQRFLVGDPPVPDVAALRSIGATHYLAAKARCSTSAVPGATLLYEDEATMLWKLP